MDKKNKIMLATGISVASIALLATVVSTFITPEAPDPEQLGSRKKITYMASKQFANLPEQEKIKYLKSIGRSRRSYRQLSSTERKDVYKNTGAIRRKIMIKKIKEHANKFFKMSEEEQNEYLDTINARRDKWRKAREARKARKAQRSKNTKTTGSNSSSSKTNTSRHGRNRNAWRQGILEGMDSTTRAQFSEIRRRARERRKKQ